MNEFEKTNEQAVSKGNKRRSFLKKSATGAVVFSLPAKSVWGACSVSGAMSGNLSTNRDRHDCTLQSFASGEQGAGVSTWLGLNSSDANESDAAANTLFSHLAGKFGTPDYATLKPKYVAYVDNLKLQPLSLPPELFSPSQTVGQALANVTNENISRLAAVFLNASLDVYSTTSAYNPTQLVNDIYLYIFTTEAQTNMPLMLNDSDFGIYPTHNQSPLILT